MRDPRHRFRLVMVVAAAAVLGPTACLPPVVLHDGMPGWAPQPRKTEFGVGWHKPWPIGFRTFWPPDDSAMPDISSGYFAPVVRYGFKLVRLPAEIGLASALATGGKGFKLVAGPEFAVFPRRGGVTSALRLSLYSLGIAQDSRGGIRSYGTLWPQLTALFGNGFQPRGVSYALGFRTSPMTFLGPLAFVGVNLGRVDLRGELSFTPSLGFFLKPLFHWLDPDADWTTGKTLTVGVTIAGPTPAQPGR